MITARPLHEYLRYSNQDVDELQDLRCDLQAHPADYLNHPDGYVRSMADWTMEYYKMRNLRPTIALDTYGGRHKLTALYQRLRELATAQEN